MQDVKISGCVGDFVASNDPGTVGKTDEHILAEFLETADIPTMRKDISKVENLLWLSRNIKIRNKVPSHVMVALVHYLRASRGE